MSRFTQYIGLNDAAILFLNRVKAERVKEIQVCEGMFGEAVMGDTWEANVNGSCITFIETVDIIPWSSGPMIFTCLDIHEQGESIGKYYRWNFDPSCKTEFDGALGVFYV